MRGSAARSPDWGQEFVGFGVRRRTSFLCLGRRRQPPPAAPDSALLLLTPGVSPPNGSEERSVPFSPKPFRPVGAPEERGRVAGAFGLIRKSARRRQQSASLWRSDLLTACSRHSLEDQPGILTRRCAFCLARAPVLPT